MHSPARVGSAPYWAPRLSERNSPGLGEEHPCSCVHRGGGVDALVRSGLRPLTCGDTVVAAHDSGDTVVRGIAQATPWRRCRLVFLRKASPLPPIPTQRHRALREACQAHCVRPAATCNPTYCAVTWSTSWDAVIALWVGAIGAGRVAETAREDACRRPDPAAARSCLTESAYRVLATCSRENVQKPRVRQVRSLQF
jgi:hypothetical protein